MKYEIIFGDERLFDGASEFVEVIRFNDYSREYLWGDLNTIQLLTFRELKAIPIVAMRRIIQEPKCWTVEDQKAGRLPDVGSEVILRATGEIATVNAANKNMVCLTFSDGGFSPFNIERIDPIETQKERAKREGDEFVSSLSGADIQDGTVKDFFAQGARAAYRKLKGGE